MKQESYGGPQNIRWPGHLSPVICISLISRARVERTRAGYICSRYLEQFSRYDDLAKGWKMEEFWFDSQQAQKSSEFFRILGNAKFHCRLYKIPAISLNPESYNPVHSLSNDFLNIYSNIILSPTPSSSELSPSLIFPKRNLTSPVPHACHVPRQSHYSSFDCSC